MTSTEHNVDDLVILRRYGNSHEAHIAYGLLQAEGIHAVVIEAAGFDPTLNEALATVLRVYEGDVAEANALLSAAEPSDTDPQPGGEDVVRCPRCELEYCYFGKPRGITSLPGPALFFSLFSTKRWRCTKCAHVWDDPHAGPAIPSQFAPEDPRPVFYLKRARPGIGVFWGAALGFLLLILINPSPYGLLPILVGPAVGWLVGRSYKYGVCSEPLCRSRLRSSHEICPHCKKTVAGTISNAREHYAAVAEVRREFAALREREKELHRNLKEKESP